MRLFLEIVIALMVAFIFVLWIVKSLIRFTLVPACAMFFQIVPGRTMEDVCNQLCQTENGEKYAALAYTLYKFGYSCIKNSDGRQALSVMIERPEMLSRMINISGIPDIDIKDIEKL